MGLLQQLQRWKTAAGVLLLWLGTASAATCNSGGKCNVRILAIGDSLTRGAVPSQSTTHPYAGQLKRSLQGYLGRPADIVVDIRAYDYMGVIQKAHDDKGNTIPLTLVPLAKSVLDQAAAARRPYSWVVVQAGINDLGAGNHTAEEIMPRLAQVYQLALSSGANVLAVLPFPNLFVARTSKNEAERLKLQQMIRAYVAQHQQQRLRSSERAIAASRQAVSGVQQPPLLQVLALPPQLFDFWQMQESVRKQYQDDLLHLTARGYDILGDLIASTIAKSTPGGSKALCGC